jgi:hypothetical protein
MLYRKKTLHKINNFFRWARHVAETTSIVGKYLNEGVLAYRNKNW